MLSKLLLTDENYYTPAADQAYMSCSQYSSFVGVADDAPCPARAMAKILGNFQDKPRDAFTQGNYFHTALEGDAAHKAFCEAHFDEIFKTKEKTVQRATKDRPAIKETVTDGPYAAYAQLDDCLRTVRSDGSFQRLLEADGENEVILSGEVFGVPWRIRCDKIIYKNHIIVDWKTCASLNQLHYSAEKKDRVTFVEYYGYLMRAAVYMEIYRQNFGVKPSFVLGCVTKQEFPAKGIYVIHPEIDGAVLQYELDKIQGNLPRIMPVKNRETAPRRCGFCEYCRKTAKDSTPLPWYMLDPRNATQPEYDNFVPWNVDPETGELIC